MCLLIYLNHSVYKSTRDYFDAVIFQRFVILLFSVYVYLSKFKPFCLQETSWCFYFPTVGHFIIFCECLLIYIYSILSTRD